MAGNWWEDESAYVKPFWQDESAYAVHRPDEPGVLEELSAKVRAGFGQGLDLMREAGGRLIPDLASDQTRGVEDQVATGLGFDDRADMERAGQAQRLVQSQREFETTDRTSESTARGLQEINEADSLPGALGAAARNPRAVGAVTAQSLGMVAPGMAGGLVAGLAAAPVAPAVIGLNSAAIEHEATIRDTLAEAGVDLTDLSQVRRALDNPELMARARERAAARGVAVGAFDALTAGLAGRLLAGARGVTSAAARAAGETGVQMGGGMAGESLAQLASDGRIKDWGDVALEGVAEIPTAITEAPGNYRSARTAFREREATREAVQGDYRDLAGEFGATITSMQRTRKRNEEVGGVPDSQHLRGTAGDFVVPEERKSGFISRAREMGYEAIDEGDHVHLELPKGTTAADMARRAQQTPGARRVTNLLDRARRERGLETPKVDRPKTEMPASEPIQQLLETARDPSQSPEVRRAAKSQAQRSMVQEPRQQLSQSINALKDQLLDQITRPQQADTATPGNPVTQPIVPQTPPAVEPQQPIAPTAPEPRQIAPEPLPAEPATPAPPQAPAPATPPPSARVATQWQVTDKGQTQNSEAVRGVFNRDNGLRAFVLGQPGNPRPRHLAPNDVVEQQLEPGQQKMLDRVGKVLGRKIILYRFTTPGNHAVSGFAADDRHIFLNAGAIDASNFSLLGVAGHEFAHTLRRSKNPLMEDLIRFAMKRINVENSYILRQFLAYEQVYSARGLSPDEFRDTFTEEMVADLIGDLINDERFWAELQEVDPPLLRKLLKNLIGFLKGLADRARRLGDDGAFHEIEQVRAKAMEMLKQHVAAVAKEKPAKSGAPLAPAPQQRDVLVDGQSMLEHAQLAPEGSIEQMFAELMLTAEGDIELAKRVLRATREDTGDEVLTALLDMVEQVEAMGPGTVVMAKLSDADEQAARIAQLESMIAEYEFRLGVRKDAAVERARALFDEGQYARASREIEKAIDKSAPPTPIDTPEKREFFKDSARSVNPKKGEATTFLHGTAADFNKFMPISGEATFMTRDSGFASLFSATAMGRQEAFADDASNGPTTGMNMMPLVTNVKNPWDFGNRSHVKRLVEELRDKFRTAKNLSAAMSDNKVVFEGGWGDVAEHLANGTWELIEDSGTGITELLREMGFDGYFVTEDGEKNLAVFDPRQIKSATGNVGSFGVRPPTAEEAASLGMTLEEALAAQEAGDIRLSLNGVMHATFTKGVLGNADKLERWFIDEFRDLNEIQKAIADSQFGGRLPEDMDARQRENLRHGSFKDDQRMTERKYIEPIIKIIGDDMGGFSRFLWWRHAPERDAYLREHMGDKVSAAPDGLAGISPQDAIANIEALDPKVRARYERAGKIIDQMRLHILDTLLESGQITQQHYDALLNQYEHWVPLRGLEGMDEDSHRGGGRGLSMDRKPLGQRAKGRRSEPRNIIEELLQDADRAAIGKYKQGVLESLIRLIVANPDDSLWAISPVTAERKWVDGVLTVVQTNGEPSNQITFMHKGVPVKIEIRHEGLRKALLGMNAPLPEVIRHVGRVTRWLSATKTSMSPFFLMVNPMRDAMLASMSVLAEHDMATLKEMARFYRYSYAALWADLYGKDPKPGASADRKKAQVYAREFAQAGGKTGYTYVTDIREQQRKLRSLVARHAQSKGMADIMAGNFESKDAGLLLRKAWQHTAHTLEVTNELAENTTRLAVYSALRERGATVEEAAAYAKEVTVNFNRRGSANRVIGAFYMFFNAAIQGSAKMTRLTVGNRKFQAMMGATFALSYAAALGQMLAAGDDDDGESKYDKAVSDGQAQRSISVYLGGGKSFPIPVPYGPNIFSYMGYRMAKFHYDMMRGRNPSTGKAAGDMVAQAITSMSPLDPGKGISALYPEIVRAPLQAQANRGDFGGKLNPSLIGSREEARNPLFDRTDPRTGDGYKWLAMALNNMTGGDAYRAGKVNWTGEQVRYVVEQTGGGPMRLASESYELSQTLLAGIDPEPSDIPLANVYFRGKGERRHSGTYYDNLADYEDTVADWKAAIERNDQAKLDEIYSRAPWVEGAELSAGTVLGRAVQSGTLMEQKRAIDKQMKSLREQRQAILADKTLDWRERKRQSREIDLQIYQLQQDFNYVFNAARGSQTRSGLLKRRK